MKLIRQEGDGGCGLACIAMLCDKPLEDVAKKIRSERKKTGYSTSISDFEVLFKSYNKSFERLRFHNWDDLHGIYIIGVNERRMKNGKREGWHWIVVIKDDDRFLIVDPDENECIHWGDCWIEKPDGYQARKNCDIIKCNISPPTTIEI